MLFFIKFLVIISITQYIDKSEAKNLKLLIVIHRHGDRTPVITYPTDPYSDEQKYFPDGLGMLTSKGKQRMYEVGKYIRKRYKKFLTDNPREVYIRSSAKERCLESVSLLMAGAYPPQGRWKWGKGLGQSWQPFPIQTTNLSHDGMLNPDSICPVAGAEIKSYLKSTTVKNLFKKHKNLVKYVEEKSGLTFDHHWVGRDLFNTLEIQKTDFGLKLPEWVNETVYEDLKQFLQMSFIFDASTDKLRRLRAGLLLKDIKNKLEETISNPKYSHKMIVYSTHDTQLSVFLTAINAYNGLPPPFGSTLFFELYQLDNTDEYDLELHYLNVTQSEKTYRLPLNGCPSEQRTSVKSSSKDMNRISNNCLKDFFKSIEKYLPKDWENECQESFAKRLIKWDL